MDTAIVLFQHDGLKLEVSVSPEQETVWLTLDQIAELFGKDRSVVSRHILNVFKEGELEESTSVQILHGRGNHRPPRLFNLDVIISVGYRVKSNRGVAFRKWANSVLKQYILKGYAESKPLNKYRLWSIQTRRAFGPSRGDCASRRHGGVYGKMISPADYADDADSALSARGRDR